MKEILKAYGISEVTVNSIMIEYSNTRSKLRLPNGDTEFFESTAGVQYYKDHRRILCR